MARSRANDGVVVDDDVGRAGNGDPARTAVLDQVVLDRDVPRPIGRGGRRLALDENTLRAHARGIVADHQVVAGDEDVLHLLGRADVVDLDHVRMIAERSHHLNGPVSPEERSSLVLRASREVLRSVANRQRGDHDLAVGVEGANFEGIRVWLRNDLASAEATFPDRD